VKKDALSAADPAAVQRGCSNLQRHIRNVKQFGVPALVALNHFTGDTPAELDAVRAACSAEGVELVPCEVWEKGGEGGVAVAQALLKLLDSTKSAFKPLYDSKLSIKDKIDTIARKIYGADGVRYTAGAERALELIPALGLAEAPVCMAKTQYSFSDDATKLGAPTGFTLNVRDVVASAGAGFVVALAGDIMTMPGLGKSPAAERIRLHPDGTIEGLF
jgi:formate--tetrahydrofolate ligase